MQFELEKFAMPTEYLEQYLAEDLCHIQKLNSGLFEGGSRDQ